MRIKKIILILSIILCIPVLTACSKSTSSYSTLDDLKGCTFANSTSNSPYEDIIEEDLPGVKISTYTNYFDTFMEVANGRKDSCFCFKYCFPAVEDKYENLSYIEANRNIPIVFNFSKDAKGNQLKKKMNQFIKTAEQSGLTEKLKEKWFDHYSSLTEEDTIDFDSLSGENGTFVYAFPPENKLYNFLIDNKPAGFEVAYVYEFCKEYGLKPKVVETQYDSVLTGTASGKYTLATGGYGYTEEKAENSNFSDVVYNDEIVYVINTHSTSSTFSITDTIYKNLVKENRWKLIVNGLVNTCLITVCSVILGSMLGFILFLIGYKYQLFSSICLRINHFFESLPILVVMMIAFYVIFGKSTISGLFVSTLTFTLVYSFTFFSLLNGSVKVIPAGQREAGLALGYSERQVLSKILIPQALETFLPGYKSSIRALLMSSSIVGYVAVQDLTKAGDLIRSQTFDAFFPIILVAIIYFIIANGLMYILDQILLSPGDLRKKKD